MHRISSAVVVLAAAYTFAGCAHWQPVEPARQPVLKQRDVLQFDFVGEKVRLHSVRFTADSVSGIPWLRNPTCDSCRTSYPLSRVDNPRVGRPEENLWFLMLPVGLGFGYLVIYAVRGTQ
jgi:hypothetical protein